MKTSLMIRKNGMLKGRLAKKAGASLVEYLLLVTLIAAGAVWALGGFGKGVVGMIGVNTSALTGQTGKAQTELANTRSQQGQEQAAAVTYNNEFTKP